MMSRIRRLTFGAIAVVVCTSFALAGIYLASQSVPDFYTVAMIADDRAAETAGDELEREVATLASDLQEGVRWELALSDGQINGWLATDLKQKFPGLLPNEVQDPRIAFQDEIVAVACRLESTQVSTVLSLELRAYLTDTPNEIAIQVSRVRAGLLPVPLTRILDRVTQTARRSGVSLRWTQQDGDPVALIEFPTDRPEIRSGVVLERLEVGPGELLLTGSADPPSDLQSPAELRSAGLAVSEERASKYHR